MQSLIKPITNHLWFDTQAREATEFYVSIFPDSEILSINTIKDTPSGDCDIINFKINNQNFIAISGGPYFKFNEAISLVIYCRDQAEIDYYWSKLSAVPESEECGWIKDKYGVSWQIVPVQMDEIMQKATPEQAQKVTKAFLAMKKFDIAKLEEAFNS
jgi:predicted 3-demethylubiquinone-9 3-methyltransferase (glyoxalase superfamily)